MTCDHKCAEILRELKAEARKPPKLLPDDKRHPLVKDGFSWGYQEALREGIERVKEADE